MGVGGITFKGISIGAYGAGEGEAGGRSLEEANN